MAIFPTHQDLRHVIEQVDPQEIYNLGAQSHVKVSFEVPQYTADVDALGTLLRLIEALRDYVRQNDRGCSLLSGGFVRNVWWFSATAIGGDAALSTQPICSEQSCGSLVLRELSGGVWTRDQQRHPLQSREVRSEVKLCGDA